ncbi:hypothetical protein KQX54_007498 [Cotesia glomerata]|uniref:Uncharacterized protein n=1 Tax=Cotesia glomerata TaxID=32391 RepID=A0AAV7I848_COTGL|nr:hypothetical protein KQX54_007498 [Cotesia glomerata]
MPTGGYCGPSPKPHTSKPTRRSKGLALPGRRCSYSDLRDLEHSTRELQRHEICPGDKRRKFLASDPLYNILH